MAMNNVFISPPIAFLVLLALSMALSAALGLLAYKPKKKRQEGGQSYACGEDTYDHMAQPDYSQFFPFAFFFTIAHVATLIVATIPAENLSVIIAAAIYISSVVAGIFILLGRE
jgi:NADH-quinone oxidoreductase subunit A